MLTTLQATCGGSKVSLAYEVSFHSPPSLNDMPKLIVRLVRALSERRRGQLPGLFLLMLVSAFAELCSVALVVPFITSLTLPEKVFGNPLAVTFFNSFAVTTESHKIDFLVGLAIFVVLVSAGIRLLMSFVTYRFAYGASAEMAARVFETALRQPFTVHLARNSSEVLGSVNKKFNSSRQCTFPVLKSMVAAVTGCSYCLGCWLSSRCSPALL